MKSKIFRFPSSSEGIRRASEGILVNFQDPARSLFENKSFHSWYFGGLSFLFEMYTRKWSYELQTWYELTSLVTFSIPDHPSITNPVFRLFSLPFRWGGGGAGPVSKRLFQLQVCRKLLSCVPFLLKTLAFERANSQLFRTSKSFEIGSLSKKL